jgi:hypothetical protein
MLTLCGSLAACGSGDDEQVSSTTGAVAPPSAPVSAPAPVAVRSKKATSAARRACQGRRPPEVIKSYLPAARKRGADKALLRMAVDPPRRVTRGPGYALLAGAVYASSLPVKQRVGVAPACAKELMRGRHVPAAAKKRKSMSNEGTSR